MMYRKIFVFLLVLVLGQVVSAESIEQLLSNARLEARAFVSTPAPHYRKAPVEIVIEVGTPDRFSGSIKVRDFTVPSTLVRRMTKTAMNEKRRREGVTWNFQTWRYQLHSERLGTLNLPEMTAYIAVETESEGEVKGELKLSVPAIQIVEAPGTDDLKSWVAANEFKVEEIWEGEQESYQVGDAVTRIRKFTVKGSPAMAIPESTSIEIEGVNVYRAPSLVDDQEVGGVLQGIREERDVFTFKGGGTFTIQEERIHWFNLQTQALDSIDFAERILKVSGPEISTDRSAIESPAAGSAVVWWYIGLTAFLVILAYLVIRRVNHSAGLASIRGTFQAACRKRQDRAKFMRAAKEQDSHRCLELLYQQMADLPEWQLSAACKGDPRMLDAAEALMAHAFGNGDVPKVGMLKCLWELSDKAKVPRRESHKLQLNPGCSE